MTREDFASLALGYLEEVTAFARRLSRNAADADDLVQGTFERAFRSWRDLRQPGACRAWLFRIARNLHLNRQRSAATRPELRLVTDEEGLAAGTFVSAEAVERLEAHDLEAALDRTRTSGTPSCCATSGASSTRRSLRSPAGRWVPSDPGSRGDAPSWRATW